MIPVQMRTNNRQISWRDSNLILKRIPSQIQQGDKAIQEKIMEKAHKVYTNTMGL